MIYKAELTINSVEFPHGSDEEKEYIKVKLVRSLMERIHKDLNVVYSYPEPYLHEYNIQAKKQLVFTEIILVTEVEKLLMDIKSIISLSNNKNDAANGIFELVKSLK